MHDKKPQRLLSSDLAGIQYAGLNGITEACISAIAQQLCGQELISKAALISCFSNHAFLLFTEYNSIIAIKSGFTSGYPGEGPRGLATALMLLNQHNVQIEEYIVSHTFFDRIDRSCLLESDIAAIENSTPVRPSKWYDYVYDQGYELHSSNRGLSRHYSQVLPFGIVDERIIDLAVKFRGNEDAVIISSFRRLEDLLRKRTGLAGEGTKLFSRVFLSEDSPLSWDVPDDGESKGRANLFAAIFMAFRNARMHREIDSGSEASMREFLLVNELYRLEAEALTDVEIKKRREGRANLEKMMGGLDSETLKPDKS